MNTVPEWAYLQDIEIWQHNVRHQDLKTPDVKYDTIRHGYWVKTNSPSYTILALKGCRFGQLWGKEIW
jgi:hypothetical protein